MSHKLAVYADASAALGIVKRRGIGKVRHIRTQSLWLQEAHAEKRLAFEKIDGSRNPADLLTKYLSEVLLDRHLQFLSCVPEDGRATLAPTLDSLGLSTRAFQGFRIGAARVENEAAAEKAVLATAAAVHNATGQGDDRDAEGAIKGGVRKTPPGQVEGQSRKAPCSASDSIKRDLVEQRKPLKEGRVTADSDGVQGGGTAESIATLKRRSGTTAIGRWADVESSCDELEINIDSLSEDIDEVQTKEECRNPRDRLSSWASTSCETLMNKSPIEYNEHLTFVTLKLELDSCICILIDMCVYPHPFCSR